MEKTKEQTYISWDKSFEIGIPLIDGQHKKLVSLCDSFYQSLLKSRSNGNSLLWESSLVVALHECTDYVREHLRQEELLMKAAGYADFAAHKKMHDTFALKILEMDSSFETVSLGDTVNFVKFLYDWIIQHIAHTDKQYVKAVTAYLAKKAKSL